MPNILYVDDKHRDILVLHAINQQDGPLDDILRVNACIPATPTGMDTHWFSTQYPNPSTVLVLHAINQQDGPLDDILRVNACIPATPTGTVCIPTGTVPTTLTLGASCYQPAGQSSGPHTQYPQRP